MKGAIPIIVAAVHLLGRKKSPLTSEQDPPSNGTLAASPPVYPSPWMSGQGDWAEAYAKARDFVSQLTLLEKVNITTGVGWEGEQCVGQVSSPGAARTPSSGRLTKHRK